MWRQQRLGRDASGRCHLGIARDEGCRRRSSDSGTLLREAVNHKVKKGNYTFQPPPVSNHFLSRHTSSGASYLKLGRVLLGGAALFLWNYQICTTIVKLATWTQVILMRLKESMTHLKKSSIKKNILFHRKRLNILCLRPLLEFYWKIFFCSYTKIGAKI